MNELTIIATQIIEAGEQATPRPWGMTKQGYFTTDGQAWFEAEQDFELGANNRYALFAANNAPILAAEVLRLTEENEKLRAVVEPLERIVTGGELSIWRFHEGRQLAYRVSSCVGESYSVAFRRGATLAQALAAAAESTK